MGDAMIAERICREAVTTRCRNGRIHLVCEAGTRAVAAKHRRRLLTYHRAVFVAHLQEVQLGEIERAARAITTRAAPLFTSSYVRGYAGANGIIFSRGAMITAAISKVSCSGGTATASAGVDRSQFGHRTSASCRGRSRD